MCSSDVTAFNTLMGLFARYLFHAFNYGTFMSLLHTITGGRRPSLKGGPNHQRRRYEFFAGGGGGSEIVTKILSTPNFGFLLGFRLLYFAKIRW